MSKLKLPPLLNPNGQEVESDGVMALNEWAHTLEQNYARKIILAGMGRPTYPVDENFTESMIASWQAIKEQELAIEYSVPAGEADAREIMANALSRLYNLADDRRLKANNIIFTAGGSSALACIFKAINADKPGGLMITPLPYYPLHTGSDGQNRLHTIDVMRLPGYRLTPEALEQKITSAKKLARQNGGVISAFIFCYPNNPTGIVLSEKEWQGIARVISSDDSLKNVPIILDESYAELSMAKPHCSLLSVAPELENRIVLLRSATKGFSAAGVRIATVACKNSALLSKITAYHTNVIGHADRITSKGYADAMAVFNDTTQQKTKDFYSPMVERVERGLREIGAAMPDENYHVEGAFYVLADLSDLIGTEMCPNKAFPGVTHILNDVCLAYHLLFDQGIMIAPFSYFGGHAKKGYVRITCSDADDCIQLLNRLEEVLVNVREKKCREDLEKIQNQLSREKDDLDEYYKMKINDISSVAVQSGVSYAKHLKDILRKIKELSHKIEEHRKWKGLIVNQLTHLRYLDAEQATELGVQYDSLLRDERDPEELIRKTELISKKLRDEVASAEFVILSRLIMTTQSKETTRLQVTQFGEILHCENIFERNARLNLLFTQIADNHPRKVELFRQRDKMLDIPFDLSRLNQKLWQLIGLYLSQKERGALRATSFLLFKMLTPLWDQTIRERKTISAIAASDYHSLLLTESGEVYVCGSNEHGAIGLGWYTRIQKTWSRLNVVNVRTVVAGENCSFLVTEMGRLYGCGANQDGELGLPHNTPQRSMTMLTTISDVSTVAISRVQSKAALFTRRSGELYGAGSNKWGLFSGCHQARDLGWHKINSIQNVRTIAAGFEFCVVVTHDGRAFVKGRANMFLQDLSFDNGILYNWYELCPGETITHIAASSDGIALRIENGNLYQYSEALKLKNVSPSITSEIDAADIMSYNDGLVVRTRQGKVFFNQFLICLVTNLTNYDESGKPWYEMSEENIYTAAVSTVNCVLLNENRELLVCGLNSCGQLALNRTGPQSTLVRSNFDPYPLNQGFFSKKRTSTIEELQAERARLFPAKPNFSLQQGPLKNSNIPHK